MAKHVIVEKCNGKCPYNNGSYWNWEKGRRYCNHPKTKGMKKIEKGSFTDFPPFCPMDEYITERCDTIQLKRKKMVDHIKKRKKCKGGG